GGASVHAEGADAGHVMAARLKIFVDGIRNIGLKIEPVEARIVWPERAEEMQRLDPRPLERLVQVRVPVGPELHHIEKRLQDSLALVVAAWRADRHEGLTVPQHNAWRQRVARPRPRAQLGGAGFVEPELLAAYAHADPGVAEDHSAADPAAARCRVEDVAIAVD